MDVITWSGPHGVSLGGSFRGLHQPSLTGYWIHDHIAGRARHKIYKMGVSKPVGATSTLEKAKAFCEGHIAHGARSILTNTASDKGEG